MSPPASGAGAPGLGIDFDALAAVVNADGEFAIAARYLNAVLEIAWDDGAQELCITDGRIDERGPRAGDRARLRLRAADEDWAQLLTPCPPPGMVDVAHAERIAYHGDPVVRAAYHGAVRRIVELMREQRHGPADAALPPDVGRRGDDIVGRYVYVSVEDVQYRVYYEEAGSPDGIPLVMQHTAGTDGRQWRHVLTDPDYAADFRLVAYDLPFHGKSSPPAGTRWWAEEYMPTKRWLLEFLAAFCLAVGLERPVFMGCSIGGLMAPVLAHDQPERYRAVIGVNAGTMPPDRTMPAAPREELPLGYLTDVYFHPHVANDWKASGVLGLMAPTSPVAAQREVAWLYGSGAPPVFRGDIVSYATQFWLSEAQARQIDTSAVDVYLLTGEYDPFAVNGGADLLASWIAGARHTMIPTAGHFAPSDNPAMFKVALDPVLEEIARSTKGRQ